MENVRVTFTQETDLFLGGKEVRARYFGRGHTNGDAVVYFPALRIFASGDLGANNDRMSITPTAAVARFRHRDPWPRTCREKQYLIDYRDVASKIPARVTSMMRDGKSKDDIAGALSSTRSPRLWRN
jgi:glyoxylase-like metal-dependent hydrolase (beta-lactamase superfamily II)